MIGPEEADEVLQDWRLLLAASGFWNLGTAPLPPPPLNFRQPIGCRVAQPEGLS